MKFIKGNAIAHATRYELHKKVDDSSYEKIGTQHIGNRQYNNRGYFNAIGALTEGTASTSNYVYTDMIDVTRLVDYVVDDSAPDYKVCAQVLTGDEDQVAAVFYSSTDRSSKVYYMTYNDVIGAGGFKAATIQSIAQEHNAGYVGFSSYAGNVDYIDVYFNNDIFFCLDDYAEVLTSGDVLVVVAVGEGDTDTDGDGIIYTDSDYSNEIIYTTTDEPGDETIVGTWLFNESISVNGGAWYNVNFTSNGVSYTAMSDRNSQTSDMHDMTLRYFKTSTIYVYAFNGSGTWEDEAYRTITINEEPTDEEFITWLKANATKQEAEEPQDNSIVGVWAFKQNATPDGLPVQTDAALIYSTATKGSTEFGKLNTFIPSTSQSSTYNIGINLSKSALPNKYVGVYTYSANYPYLAFGRANSTQGVSTLAQYIAAIEFYSNIESDDIVIDERFVTWLKANATKQSTFNFITFTIGTTTYQAEEGMTWLEWVGSRYNTKGYTCDGVAAYIERGNYLVKQSDNTPPVVGSDYIINEGVYIDYNNSPSEGGGSNY